MTTDGTPSPDPASPPVETEIDEYGMPVPPPSSAATSLLLAGVMTCAIGADGMLAANVTRFSQTNGHFTLLGAIGTVLGLVPLAVRDMASTESARPGLRRLRRVRNAAGLAGERVWNVAVVAGLLAAFALFAMFFRWPLNSG